MKFPKYYYFDSPVRNKIERIFKECDELIVRFETEKLKDIEQFVEEWEIALKGVESNSNRGGEV